MQTEARATTKFVFKSSQIAWSCSVMISTLGRDLEEQVRILSAISLLLSV